MVESRFVAEIGDLLFERAKPPMSRFVATSEGIRRIDYGDALEKGSFGSRSEAGRYAANIRWQDNQSRGTTAYANPATDTLDRLLSSGHTIQTVLGNDLATVGRIERDAGVAFRASLATGVDKDRRRAAWSLVKVGLGAGDQHDSHFVLRDANGRVAGVATARFGFTGDELSSIPPDAVYIETLGTTGLTAGAGSALLGAVIREAVSRGKTVVQLESYPDAMPFYEKMGFKQFRLNNLGQFTNEMELEL